MSDTQNKLFLLAIGITGICEMILGLSIVFFASWLQNYFAAGVLPEPLNLRILGMMDFFIGAAYLQIARRPEYYRVLNRGSSFLRLGLSGLFFVEGFWLLERNSLRIMYQFLAFFDFFLFAIQTVFLKRGKMIRQGKIG